ncbi:very short patch repair endonuclease [Pedococcus soli]
MTKRPSASSEEVRRRFERQKRKDTTPELILRRLLYAAGLRYRVNFPVPGILRRSIDVAFTKQRLAVFVDGCFWHGCSEHFIEPKRNTTWWLTKIEANRRRDRATDEALTALGWSVLRIWEHEIRASPAGAAQRVSDSLGGARDQTAGMSDRSSASVSSAERAAKSR